MLRVEDTDQERNTDEARDAIFSGMEWLGLTWDEGQGKGGEFGPYNQSERLEIYEKWFKHLIDTDRVYEDDGAYRFRFEREVLTYTDLICGDITIDYTDVSINPDIVVRRSDGSFVFHFVNVVDDLEMGITHVIRGEDHVMNTPKHLQLFKAFGVEPPVYAHIPLILNPNGSKMSKRDDGAAVSAYPENGFLPEAVFNYIALLGWSPKDDTEIFTPEELIEKFDLSGVNRAPGKFDIEKCKWMNQQHIARLSSDEFAQAAAPFVEKAGLPTDGGYARMAASVQEKVSLLTEVAPMIAFFTQEEVEFDADVLAKVAKNDQAGSLLAELATNFAKVADWNVDSAKAAIMDTAKANGAKPGQLMFPTRVALSGMGGGPDLGEILAILGKDESAKRVERLAATLA
mgnify:CR=1 FL=1